jgi:probable O-glycosylation ligase (exosortase A-associated)
MRDAVIALLIVGCALWSLRQPWIGVMAWTLVSLMSPHEQFGYAAASWPVGTVFAATTLFGLAITKSRQNPLAGPGAWWLLAFMAWTCVTLPASIFFDESYPLWVRSMKIWLMVFVSLALITDRRKLDIFIWINVVAIGYYGVKGGLFTILSGGHYKVWGPGGFIQGNNEVALAVLTVVPLMRYLQLQMTHKHAIMAMTAAMALCVVMALGTYSRGALLGLCAMGTFFWLKGKNKVRWGMLIVVIGMAALSLMPDQWWDRMDTIKTYDADASALGRINAWWMAFNLAKDRVFGGGFMIWTGVVFQKYAPVGDDPHAAHSIYFQVMGEHGFIGLFLFMMIGATTWWTARGLIKSARLDPAQRWAGELGAMVQVSMIAYAVSGAFLSLAYFDLPYNVMMMAILARLFVERQLSVSKVVQPQYQRRALPQASASGPRP